MLNGAECKQHVGLFTKIFFINSTILFTYIFVQK